MLELAQPFAPTQDTAGRKHVEPMVMELGEHAKLTITTGPALNRPSSDQGNAKSTRAC